MTYTVFTNGCFDILHVGHIELFKYCKNLSQGGSVIVGLNSDDSVKKLKGESRPINKEKYRKIILESIRYIDEVIIFNEETPETLLSKVKPDILVKGGDYTFEQIIVKQYASKIVIFPLIDEHSTTRLVEKTKNIGDR